MKVYFDEDQDERVASDERHYYRAKMTFINEEGDLEKHNAISIEPGEKVKLPYCYLKIDYGIFLIQPRNKSKNTMLLMIHIWIQQKLLNIME